mgnify:CR=1 FL=1
MTDLSPAQAADRITKLLVTPESRTLDFKRISDKHKKIVETVCAFANSEGGLLALGVGDAKDLKAGDKPQSRLWGVEENPEGFDDLRRLLLQRFTPALPRLHWLRMPCTLRDGKPKYLADAPRFIHYLRSTCSRYRELGPLLRLIDQIENIQPQVGYAYGRV